MASDSTRYKYSATNVALSRKGTVMRLIAFVPVIIAVLSVAPARAQQPIDVPAFRAVQLMGGGDVQIRPGSHLSVTLLEGSTAVSDFRVERDGQLRILACRSRCPANYHLRVLIQSPSAIDAGVMGGGGIDYAPGFAPNQKVAAAVHGGGSINARSLRLDALTAAVNGGGTISAGNVSSLTAAINGGGTITYEGDPAITQAIHGGGIISRAR
jgi:hypothetical protein